MQEFNDWMDMRAIRDFYYQRMKFKIAFVGGNRKAKQTDNKYEVPRYIVYKNTSLESFKSMIN